MSLGPSLSLFSVLAFASAACFNVAPIDPSDDGGEDDTDPGDDGGDVDPSAAVASTWGRLASEGHRRDRLVATLFFPGEARDGTMRYEYATTSNLELFTEHPSDPRLLHWSSDPSTRDVALDQMVETGVN